MAVNIVRKSKDEDEEEKRKQLLAQMQENSQARKNAEIQAVKNSNVKFNNPYVGGGSYLAGKYVAGLGEGTTNIVSAPMQTLALGFQQGSKQASKEQTTWDKIKNIGKNTFKTFAYADPTMITRLMYDTTVGRDEFIQNANEVNTQIQQNASQADSTWKKATAYLGGYGSFIQKQYLNSGLNQLQTGAQSVGQVLGSEKSQQASQALLEADDKLHEPIDKLNEELSKSEGAQNKVIRRLGNASYTIGNMTPSILISALSGGAGASDATREALSLTSMGISAKGGSTREGLKQGLDLSTAERIGVSKGMVEVGTEKMWNGLSFLKSPDSKVGSAIRTWIGKQVEDRIKSQFGKTVLTKWIPDLAGETLEEFVSGIYDNWLDRATVDPNRGSFFKEQSLDTLIDTTLSTLLMNAPSYVLETKAIHDRNKSGNQTNVNTEESNGYKQNLQEMVNNLDIPNEMKAELQQTIDSNETITGEEYNNTKERIKSLVKANTQQQIDSLSNDLNNQYIDINNRLSELDNIKAENFKDPESRRFYAQQINKEFGDTTLDSILAGYPENRNGNRTVKQYKEIAKEYGKQMAENGLTFDEVRANTIGAWQYYEPNKNITQYDNQQKKNVSFDRLNSQVWSQIVYDSYKDTMRTQLQQQQEALSTQMNDELTRLQDEENILIDTIDRLGTQETEETRERDINSVNDRVQKYIDKNNLDMTVEEFKKWAQERQLENEDITDENQRELYDLISDVQNIVYKDEIKNQEKQTKKKLTLDSIKEKYKNNVDVLNISENGDYISLGNLVVKENQRNKGIGQKILNDLIQYADENNKTITLTPTSEFNTKNKLKQWYKNNGFVENKGKNTDFLINDTMYRRPVQQSNKLESQQGSFNSPKNIEIDGTEYEVKGKETSPYQRKTQKEWDIDSIQEQLKKEQSPTTPIKAELDKFDSFDEMKDNIYYHGSIGYNQNLKAGSTLREDQRTGGYGEAYHTISLSKNRNLASNFASMGSTGVVTPVLLRKDARVIKMDNVSDSIELEDYLPELWKNNIDAVELGEGSEEELVVLNPNAITVIGKGRTDFKNYGKPKFQNLNTEDLEALYQDYKEQEVSELKEKIDNETNEAKKESLQKELDTLQKKSVQDIGTDNATYDTNTILTHEQLREFKDQVENEINSRYGDNSAKIYISAPASGFIIEVDNKISGEEFKQRLNTNDSKELFKQIRPILSELTQEAGFDVDNIINPGNQTTENPDIRYEQANIQEDNTEMNEWQKKVNQAMTMEEAKTMIEKAFNTQKDFVDFDNAEDWLRNDPGEVGMIIENTESLIYQYINSNQDILNEEYTIDDVIDAYMEGTLTGKSKVPTTRLDISKQNNYVDNKFYAPKDIQGGKELYETANQRVTKTNAQEVYRARGNFIINAHQKGYVESIGLTQEEANKKIKQWANYSEKTMKLSNEINKDASTQNRWTGLENSSIVNTIGISNEELNSMVKGIEGANEEWQRRYITSAFLAIDTHIDYSDLSFVFEENSNKSYLGLYDGSKKTIYISPDYRAGQNTVAHEIGHYLDEKWGKQLFGYTNGLMNLSQQGDFEGLTSEQKQFVINFRNFAEDIQNTSDMRSNYTMTPTEVFARFVGRFTEWTKNQATSNRYGYEEKYYKDNFTERQYIEFAKLLQEKALLDTTTEYANIDKVKNQKGLVTEEKISDIFDDLNKRKKVPTKQTQLPTTNVQPTTESLEIPNDQTSLPLGEQVNPSERKQRKAYKSIIESPVMSEEAKKVARKFIGQDTYTPDSNLKQLERADNIISRLGTERALNQLESNAMEGRTIKAEDIATGDRLIEYYSKIGDSENLQRAIRATAMAGTQAGRSVQAFALLKHQTPQGMAVWIQNSVDKLNSQTKNGQFDFTTEMQEKILNSTEDNLQENVDEVMKELGQQVPQSLLGKLDTWRYFSMLANPKTHIRNIVGNFAMGLTQQVKSKVAGTIEQVTGQDRTHTSLFEKRSRANIDFAKNDLKNVSAQLGIGESKYSNPKNQIQQNQRVFKSDALEKSLGRMFKLNDNLLEAEDNFGLKNAYVRNLSDYMTANKLNPKTITNEQLQQARKVAVEEALRATFHQESSLASMLNQIENKNLASRILMGGLVPFKKTPINVAKSGFEYSPAGLAKAIVYDSVQLRKGNINVNEYIDNISKGLTGTGIALVGYALAEAGILKAGGDDDKDEKYRQAMGEQPYSIMINGKSYSLDWLAPTGIPLFVGAELNKLMHDKTEKDGETQNDVLKAMGRIADATTSLLNPMSEMSMISGLTSTIQSFSTDPGGALMNLVVSPVKSYVGQVVPTAVGQVARTMDKYERDTSSTETGLLPKAIDQTKNQIMNKIPGLRQMLPTKKDVWGEEVETQDYFHNAVLPYTEKEIKTNAVDKELNDLFEKTGESIYPNTSLSKTVTYEGSKTRLTNQDYNEFKTNYGKTSYKLLEDLTKSQEYKGMTDAQKVQAIKDVYTYANNLNKTEYAEKKGIEFKTPTDVQQVRAVKAYGGKESDYFKYKGITDGLSKDSEKMVALRDSNLSAKSKRAVYSATLGKDDTFFQSTDINVNEYLGYKTANIQGVKDSNGKTISGSKKAAQLDYINNNISGYENRLLLMGKDYKLSRSQQQDLSAYIDTLDNAEELYTMFDKNFTVKSSSNLGQYGKGNIDLYNRPIVTNSDGSISTVRSMSFEENGQEVLIPTVVNGRVVSDDEAIDHYHRTGEYLGKFNSIKEADDYAEKLHEDQEKMYSSSGRTTGYTVYYK